MSKIRKMKILIKYATRQRPKLFKQTLTRYLELLSGKNDVTFVVSMDRDDRTMNTQTIRRWLGSRQRPRTKVLYSYGRSSNKIQAINADLEGKTFDILILASDDVLPVRHGYDARIARDMRRHFKNLDGSLHYNDGFQGRKLNTLVIMGFRLYQRFGYIYHPSYRSVFCDNEFTEVARRWKKSVYIDDVILRNDWIAVTGVDALLKRNSPYTIADKRNYERRKAEGFRRCSETTFAKPKEESVRLRDLRVSARVPLDPKEAYQIFANAKHHARLTRKPAKISKRSGGRFEIFGGYIHGVNRTLLPGQKIVQSWRAIDWPKKHFSTVELEFRAVKNGTQITLSHRRIPDVFLDWVENGWREIYLEPLSASPQRRVVLARPQKEP